MVTRVTPSLRQVFALGPTRALQIQRQEQLKITRAELFGGRPGRAGIVFERGPREFQAQQELERQRRIAQARALIEKSKEGLAALSATEKLKLEKLIKPKVVTREAPDILRDMALSPLERFRASQERTLEAQRTGLEAKEQSLDLKEAELLARFEVLQRQARTGVLLPGVAAKFNTEIKNLQKERSSLEEEKGTQQAKITAFKTPTPTRAVPGIPTKPTELLDFGIAAEVEARRPPPAPITGFLAAQPTGERGAFGIPSEAVVTGEAFPVIRQMFDIGGLFREGKKEAEELAAFLGVQPSIAKEAIGIVGGLVTTPVSFVFKPAGAFVQQVLPKDLQLQFPIPMGAEKILLGAKQVPFLRGLLPFVVARKPGDTALLTFGRPELAESIVIGASFVIPAAKAKQPFKVVTKEPSFFPTPKKAPLTKAQIQKTFLEAITEPTKPITLLATFKPKEPSFFGLKKVEPREGPSPPALDFAGLVFKRQKKVKFVREKPLPFFEEFAPKERVITIQKPKAKVKVKKKKPPSIFEPSTEAFPRVTQRFRRRFFEEFERGPLEQFVPAEARAPGFALFPRVAALTTGLIGTRNQVAEFQKMFFVPGAALTERQLQRVGEEFRELQKAGERQLQLFRDATLTREVVRTRERLRQAQLERIRQRQRTRLRQIRRVVERTRIIPKVKIPVRRGPPKGLILLLPKPKEEEELITRKGKVQGFNVQVKQEPFRKRKFLRVNKKALPREAAIARGAFVADQTIAQTFRIKKVQKRVRPRVVFDVLRTKFRTTKRRPNIFIEKRAFAIDTPGEVQKLKVSKFLAEERKRGLGLLGGGKVARRRGRKTRMTRRTSSKIKFF